MRTRIFALLVLAATVSSASPRHERMVLPAGRGPNRLDVDVELLAHSIAGLADLRLFDARGREVGYLLIPPRAQQPQWVEGRILPIAATKKTSGVEIDLGTVTEIDRLRLDGIAAPFLKRVRLEGSGDRARWTLLSETTVFDLPDEKLQRTEIEFTAGRYRYLRIVWDDRTSARVSAVPRAAARVHASGSPPESLRREVSFQRLGSERRKSRYRIDLLSEGLPIEAIEVKTFRGDVFRRAEVSEPRVRFGQVELTSLGSSTLRRAERGDAVATDMSIAIARPTGRQIELLIDDGDNAPLEIVEISARFAPQPWIYFESPDGEPLVARAGDASLERPRYDIEASRAFAEKGTPPSARWAGEVSPSTQGAPISTAAPPNRGAWVNASTFRISRAVPMARKGPALLVLDLDVLARSRGLADVRLVDSEGAQVQYVIEEREIPIVIRLPLPRRAEKRATSIYRLTLPYESLPPGSRLTLTAGDRVFHREVHLVAPADNQRDQQARTLGNTAWASASPEETPPPLSFDVAGIGRRVVELRIDEADNAPLPIRSAELVVPGRALRFVHPGESLALLYGNSTVGPPRYDFALVAPRLRGSDATVLTLRPVAPPSPVNSRSERRLFWIGVVLAAIVLIGMLGRLLR